MDGGYGPKAAGHERQLLAFQPAAGRQIYVNIA